MPSVLTFAGGENGHHSIVYISLDRNGFERIIDQSLECKKKKNPMVGVGELVFYVEPATKAASPVNATCRERTGGPR